MSHFNPGLISAYNSLTDKHLIGYFSSSRIRKHLRKAGLITRSGRIVPDKEYKQKLLQRAHQKHVRDSLAQTVFLKVLEMERLHQMEMKKKLEEFARKERVHKMKVERAKRFGDNVPVMSPRPPKGARGVRKQHSGPVDDRYGSSESPCSSRPNTAPGKMQRPVRLKPINSGNKRDNRPPFNCSVRLKNMEPGRRETTQWEPPSGVSPYLLPVINNFVMPLPPATKRNGRASGGTSGLRGRRRLRAATASAGLGDNEEQPYLRTCVPQSGVCVTMVYFGKSVHLSHDSEDPRDEVKVFQQHCGGENLCVYKGKLSEGESFQFVSRRHRGFPFSLTFFLNGLQVERLSSCCEYKHRRGARLGGKHGHFGFSAVERASPCYKCIIAMGLDKRPTPPPKRVKDGGGSLKEARSAPHSGRESASPQQQDKHRDDYEEDFEGDDNVAAEEAKEKKALPPASGTEAKTKTSSYSDDDDDKGEVDDPRPRSSSSSSNESDIKSVKDSKEDDEAEEPEEVLREETTDEKADVNPEETAATESSTDVYVSDSSEKERRQTTPREEIEGEVTEDGCKSEEPERAKSVQEKLAEAILKESHSSSEPELSDTSTEEEEVVSTKKVQDARKDEAGLVESKLEDTSEPKEFIEESHGNTKDERGDSVNTTEQEELKEAEDGDDSEAKLKEEPQDNASAISTDKIIANGDKTSELEVAPEDSRGMLETTASKEDSVKDEASRVGDADEASGDIEETGKGQDDMAKGGEERSPDNKPSDANEGVDNEEKCDESKTEEIYKTEDNIEEDTKDDPKNNQEAETILEDKSSVPEKTEADNDEVLDAKSTEVEELHEERADEVTETKKDNEEISETIEKDDKDTEESKDGRDKNETPGEEIQKGTWSNMGEREAEDRKDMTNNNQEKIGSSEVKDNDQINKGSTDDKEENKAIEKDENEAVEIENVTEEEEKIFASEVKETEKLDKVTTSKEERDDNEIKDGTDKDEVKTTDVQDKEGEEINKATSDDMLDSEAIEKEQSKDEMSKYPDEDKEIHTAETKDGDLPNEVEIENTKKSEHEDETMHTKEDAEDTDSKERPETSKSSEEQLRNQDENIGMTEEMLATKNLITENGRTSEVDAKNGETSTQVESNTHKDESNHETSDQNKIQQPNEVSIEDKRLEVKNELSEEVQKDNENDKTDLKNELSEEVQKENENDKTNLIENLESYNQNSRQDHQDKKTKETPQIDTDPFVVAVDKTEKLLEKKEEESLKLLSQNMDAKDTGKTLEETFLLQSQSKNQLTHGESPETLARSSSTELVTNWLTTHQASKFFETFVEPLEDLKEPDAGAVMEVRKSLQNGSKIEDKAQSYVKSYPSQNDLEMSHEEMGIDVKQLLTNNENEPKFMEKHDCKESLVKDKMESRNGWREASVSGPELKPVVEIVMKRHELNSTPTSTEDINSFPKTHTLPTSDKIDERTSPEGKTHGGVLAVTEVSHFTTSRSDAGSHMGMEDKPSVNGSKQLMEDNISQDRLSVLSAEKMPFGPNSYSLLTSARIDSGY
nr:glutamate-rich protein 3-like [Nerophis lumbriciformis]